jgi:hypothetical protein
VKYAWGLGKHGQERMVTQATWTMRVISLGRTFLMTTTLEDGRIQIEAIALLGHQEECQENE